jgi:hypothetical protein
MVFWTLLVVSVGLNTLDARYGWLDIAWVFACFAFGAMDPARKILLRDSEPVNLTSKTFDLLQVLSSAAKRSFRKIS